MLSHISLQQTTLSNNIYRCQITQPNQSANRLSTIRLQNFNNEQCRGKKTKSWVLLYVVHLALWQPFSTSVIRFNFKTIMLINIH